jgi:hypothetical protein
MVIRLLGVSHLDIVRASTFVATAVGNASDAPKYTIPVVGGHSGATILPLLSQSEPKIVSASAVSLTRAPSCLLCYTSAWRFDADDSRLRSWMTSLSAMP